MTKNTTDKQPIPDRSAAAAVMVGSSIDGSSSIEVDNDHDNKTNAATDKTIEKSFEKILSYTFQGFLVGSIMGLNEVKQQQQQQHQQQQQQQQQSGRSTTTSALDEINRSKSILSSNNPISSSSANTTTVNNNNNINNITNTTSTTSSSSFKNSSLLSSNINSILPRARVSLLSSLSPSSSSLSYFTSPLLYEDMAISVAKRGGHLGLICGLFASGLEISSYLRKDKNKECVDYVLTGAICGIASGMYDGLHLIKISKHTIFFGIFGILCYYSKEKRENILKLQTDISKKIWPYNYQKENKHIVVKDDVKDSINNSVIQSSSQLSNNLSEPSTCPKTSLAKEQSNKGSWWW